MRLTGLPEAGTASDLARAIVSAAANGDLPSEVVVELIGVLAGCARVIETEKIATRLHDLERLLL